MSAIIGYGNLIESATITTGGVWSGSYPANNVKNRYLGVFARNTDGNGALYIDLGSAQTIGLIGVAGISLAASASVSVRWSTDGWSSYTWVQTAQPQTDYGVGSSYFVVVSNVSARYWSIGFGAPPGNHDIGRVFIGSKFAPTYPLSFGASLGRESRTTRDESIGGTRFHRARPSRRTLTGSFDYLSDDEAHTWRSIQGSLDISNEAVLIWDDTDTSNKRVDRNMLCNLDELDSIEFPYASERKVGIRLSEVIA